MSRGIEKISSPGPQRWIQDSWIHPAPLPQMTSHSGIRWWLGARLKRHETWFFTSPRVHMGGAKSNISTYFFIFFHIFDIFLHISDIFLHICDIFLHISSYFRHIPSYCRRIPSYFPHMTSYFRIISLYFRRIPSYFSHTPYFPRISCKQNNKIKERKKKKKKCYFITYYIFHNHIPSYFSHNIPSYFRHISSWGHIIDFQLETQSFPKSLKSRGWRRKFWCWYRGTRIGKFLVYFPSL